MADFNTMIELLFFEFLYLFDTHIDTIILRKKPKNYINKRTEILSHFENIYNPYNNTLIIDNQRNIPLGLARVIDYQLGELSQRKTFIKAIYEPLYGKTLPNNYKDIGKYKTATHKVFAKAIELYIYRKASYELRQYLKNSFDDSYKPLILHINKVTKFFDNLFVEQVFNTNFNL